MFVFCVCYSLSADFLSFLLGLLVCLYLCLYLFICACGDVNNGSASNDFVHSEVTNVVPNDGFNIPCQNVDQSSETFLRENFQILAFLERNSGLAIDARWAAAKKSIATENTLFLAEKIGFLEFP